MTAAAEITPETLGAMPLPQPRGAADKDARGRILVVAGGARVPGAAVLCGLSAMRAGAGKLQMAATGAYAHSLAFALPEAMVVEVRATAQGEISPVVSAELRAMAAKADAVVVGPGLLQQAAAGSLACVLLNAAPQTGFVIDAAALTGLAAREGARQLCCGRAVLTPHPGEMAALMRAPIEQVEADLSGFAHRAADRLQAVVALKSRDTHICSPDGRAWINRSGAAGLATSGSGDVLAGIIGGLLARGAPPETAAVWGVFLHAQAGQKLTGEIGRLGFLAREIPACIPALLDRFDPG